jgi:hypothetical protein
MPQNLLEELESEFGIEERDNTPHTEDVKFGNRTYTLRKLNQDDLEKVTALALDPADGVIPTQKELININEKIRKGTITPEELEDYSEPDPVSLQRRTQTCFVAMSLAAIDGEPVWKLFKIATIEQLGTAHPLKPPPRIKYKTARRVLKFLKASTKNLSLIDALWNYYSNNIDIDTEGDEEEKKEDAAVEGVSEPGKEGAPPLSEQSSKASD